MLTAMSMSRICKKKQFAKYHVLLTHSSLHKNGGDKMSMESVKHNNIAVLYKAYQFLSFHPR